MLSDLTGDIYRQYSRLVGHTEAICSLAANSTGTLLASGGLDGTFIWSVAKGTPLMIPPSTTVRGGTTALCWITGPNDRFEILAVGSSCGFILLWRQASDGTFKEACSKRIGQGSEIMCIASDEAEDAGYRIALASYDCRVQVWVVDSSFEQRTVFSIQLDSTIPRALIFAPDSTHNVLVFSLRDGYIHTLDSKTGNILSSKEIGFKIKTACVDAKKKYLLVDDTSNGFFLFSISNGALVQTYSKTGKVQKRVPKEATFAEDGEVVIGGSNHGYVYVWNRSTGALNQQVRHPDGGLVQKVVAFEKDGRSYFASASSGDNNAISIYLWRKEKLINTKALNLFYDTHLRGPIKRACRAIFLFIVLPILALCMFIGVADALYRNAHVIRSASINAYDMVRDNARDIQKKYFRSSPHNPTATVVTDPNIMLAWEAKKEVELLRETMEAMFLNFGDTLQEALQNRQQSPSETKPSEEMDDRARTEHTIVLGAASEEMDSARNTIILGDGKMENDRSEEKSARSKEVSAL